MLGGNYYVNNWRLYCFKKEKDKLDEFDFQKHSENMGAVIQYVMDYLMSI